MMALAILAVATVALVQCDPETSNDEASLLQVGLQVQGTHDTAPGERIPVEDHASHHADPDHDSRGKESLRQDSPDPLQNAPELAAFNAMDIDADGVISLSEFQKAAAAIPPELRQHVLQSLASNPQGAQTSNAAAAHRPAAAALQTRVMQVSKHREVFLEDTVFCKAKTGTQTVCLCEEQDGACGLSGISLSHHGRCPSVGQLLGYSVLCWG